MADAVVKYAQSVAATTATTTTWVDLASLAATEFEANKTYLILANQVCTHDNISNYTQVRLVRGTTPTVFDDASCSWEGQGQGVSAQDHEISYMFFFTQPSTAELVKLQISSNTTGSTITNKLSQIIAIKLSDDFTENTHYFKTEDLVDYTMTASPVAKATTGSFTPNGTDRWLFIGNMIEDVVTIVDEIGFELYDSVAGVLGLVWQEAEDTADQRAHSLFWAGVPTNAARTLAIRPVNEAGSNIMLAGRTIALNLTTMFAQSASTFAAAEVDITGPASYSTVATIAPNPTNTGNWVVIAFATVDSAYSVSGEAESRLQINPGGGGLVDNPAYSSTSPGGDSWDDLDENPFNVFNLVSLTSGGARTMNYDFREPASTVLRVEDNGLVAFSVAKAASNDVAIAESASATESPSAVYTATPAQAETSSASDSPSSTFITNPSLTDSLTAIDSASATVITSASITEAASAIDSTNAIFVIPVSIAESTSATEIESVTAVFAVSITESASAIDSDSAIATMPASITETVTALDVSSVVVVTLAQVTESISASDISDGTVGSGSVNILESASALDVVSVTVAYADYVTETITALDIPTATAIMFISITESISASELTDANIDVPTTSFIRDLTLRPRYQNFTLYDRDEDFTLRKRSEALTLKEE